MTTAKITITTDSGATYDFEGEVIEAHGNSPIAKTWRGQCGWAHHSVEPFKILSVTIKHPRKTWTLWPELDGCTPPDSEVSDAPQEEAQGR